MIHFYQNSISGFPFALLSQMPVLKELRLYGNQISGFPTITSQSLEVLSLGYNPLGTLPVTAFASTPSLTEIHLYWAAITDILPGTIVNMNNLTMVSLRDNHLTSLPEACIVMPGLPYTNVYLHNNTITSVAPNAITGVGGGVVGPSRQPTDGAGGDHVETHAGGRCYPSTSGVTP
ncbi:hypothetical protein Pmani_039111 [Petrolisthes manimaculis]|uniref:Uncharacterized protein n=1 Tax=Petrolisthes manimaculis TaxID=1843537 RepID=A0AAE1NED6_9EUCA|nr:hypothetical protein Pmani_039111 [Petrolisthes manimaculis]